MLAGGVHLSHDVAFWSVFCQLGALSRTERMRPFDANADGLLIGEGLGVIVLKRLEDAIAHQDRIYAVIRGTGVASDGRPATLMMPDAKGQVRAVQQAWERADLNPGEVGLIEAHGTATPLGDSVELETLATVFGSASDSSAGHDSKVTLGSVKSMIGHTMPAAGIAGVIKAAMAVYDGILPPSLHCETPHDTLAKSRFVVRQAAENWNGNRSSRIAGVNAFGFGGINTHLVLQSHGNGSTFEPAIRPRLEREGLLRLAANSVTELLERIDAGEQLGGQGPIRLAVANPTAKRMAQARKAVESGRKRTVGRGIWFTTEGLLGNGCSRPTFRKNGRLPS